MKERDFSMREPESPYMENLISDMASFIQERGLIKVFTEFREVRNQQRKIMDMNDHYDRKSS